MTAEAEALLARLDAGYLTATDTANAAALIREQAEEIDRLKTDYTSRLNKHAQPCCQQWDTCERQCVPLVKILRVRLALAKDEWNDLDAVYKRASEQIAAATRQEPVAWMNKEGSVISREARDFPMDCLVVPLYSAPIPAGDAVSVERNLHKDCAKNGCHAFRVGFRKCDNGECHRK
jgi:hypothetical protein